MTEKVIVYSLQKEEWLTTDAIRQKEELEKLEKKLNDEFQKRMEEEGFLSGNDVLVELKKRLIEEGVIFPTKICGWDYPEEFTYVDFSNSKEERKWNLSLSM